MLQQLDMREMNALIDAFYEAFDCITLSLGSCTKEQQQIMVRALVAAHAAGRRNRYQLIAAAVLAATDTPHRLHS